MSILSTASSGIQEAAALQPTAPSMTEATGKATGLLGAEKSVQLVQHTQTQSPFQLAHVLVEIADLLFYERDNKRLFENRDNERTGAKAAFKMLGGDEGRAAEVTRLLERQLYDSEILHALIKSANGGTIELPDDEAGCKLKERLSRLTQFDLAYVSITAQTLTSLLSITPNLQILNLRRVTFGDDAAAEGAMEVLTQYPSLSRLSLVSCSIKDGAVSKLASSKSLVAINLEDSDITGQGLQFSETIQEVSFRSCKKLIEAAAAAISKKPHLAKVDLTHTTISWSSLEFSDAIREVSFRECWKLTEAAASAISKKPHLAKADLAWTPINWSSLEFSDAIEEVDFFLCQNLIEDTAAVISRKPHLTKATLGGTNISWSKLEFSDAIEDVDFSESTKLTEATVAVISGKPHLVRAYLHWTNINWDNLHVSQTTRVERSLYPCRISPAT